MKKNNFLSWLPVILAVMDILTITGCKKKNLTNNFKNTNQSAKLSMTPPITQQPSHSEYIDFLAQPGQETIQLNVPCERVVLPSHEVLWQALAAMQIKYSLNDNVNTSGHKHYVGIFKDLQREFYRRNELPADSLAPGPNDVLPFLYPISTVKLVSYSYNLARNSTLGSRLWDGFTKVSTLWGKTYTPISDARSVGYFVLFTNLPNAYWAATGSIYNAYKTASTRNSYSFIKDLIPNEEEPVDPDACTCNDHLCDKLAQVYVERTPEIIARSAVSIIPVVGKYCYAVTMRYARKIDMELGSAVVKEKMDLRTRFKEKEKFAKYLWDAAQTKVVIRNIDAHKSNWTDWGRPSYSPDSEVFIQKKGCPKAIALIASMVSDYYKESNYMQTLAAITAPDGMNIVANTMIWE